MDTLFHRQIPIETDVFIYLSNVENRYSFRVEFIGSFFIESMCYVLDRASGRVDINALVAQISNRVVTVHQAQAPKVTHQLRKWLFFNFDTSGAASTARDRSGHVSSREIKTALKWRGSATGKIDKNLFAPFDPGSVREVDITESNNTVIPASTFTGFKRLERLVLGANGIEIIDRQVFKGLASLRGLYLTSEKIKSLPAKVFCELTSLVELELSCNEIEIVDKTAFSGLVSLKALSIRINKIK
jgi:Leucine-rich repeat (LRR) protein